MVYTAFVDGQEGTTGLRIHEYLAKRRDIEVLRIAPEQRKDAAARARLLNAADVAFLCLPDAAAREAAAMVVNPRTCLIDASTAHRTLPDWVFGLPELCTEQRARLRQSKRISNPGCHASAFILLLRPLVDAGLVPPHLPISASAITGYSGGGRKMIEAYEGPQGRAAPSPPPEGVKETWGGPAFPCETAAANGSVPTLTSPRPYGLSFQHKHVPEMMVHTGLVARPIFMPIVSNFYKGLTVAVPLHLSQLAAGTTAEHIQRAFEQRYAGERFIRVMPLRDAATLESGYFDVQAANDTNRVDLFVFASDTQAIVMARLDNLGKGASGAAVQAMNVHLGVDEGLGLD